MLGSSTFKYLIAFGIWCVAAIAEWIGSRMDREQSLKTGSRRFESHRCGFFRLKRNTFFKIEDKLSSKNLSPEIAVNYCKTVQVSVNHG